VKSIIQNERGAVLITGMMILLVLTLIGITAMQSTSLEEVMSRNQASRNIAFQAAEAALREGENFLTAPVLPDFSGTNVAPSANGLYQPNIDVSALVWDNTDSTAYTGTIPAGAFTAPRYIIEELGIITNDELSGSVVASMEVDARIMYRITGYGVGSQQNVVVILQTTYIR